MDFFFTIVHVIQKLVNWSDKKIMLVPQKSANKATCSRSTRSSGADVSSVTSAIPGSERVPNAPNVLPTASGIINKRKQKKKREANEDKEFFQRLCEAVHCKEIHNNNRSLNILNRVWKTLYI